MSVAVDGVKATKCYNIFSQNHICHEIKGKPPTSKFLPIKEMAISVCRVHAARVTAKLPSSLTRARPSEIKRTRFPWIHVWLKYLDKLDNIIASTDINHKGMQRTANKYAEERRIYKDLISKNNNVDILNSASRILQCWSCYVKINSARHQHDTERTQNRAGL